MCFIIKGWIFHPTSLLERLQYKKINWKFSVILITLAFILVIWLMLKFEVWILRNIFIFQLLKTENRNLIGQRCIFFSQFYAIYGNQNKIWDPKYYILFDIQTSNLHIYQIARLNANKIERKYNSDFKLKVEVK